ncbi:MAG: T9SS type A sorting domain-containing protein [Candidatus Kapabacteria bacterium]|nr:T9SS type A sorting domain-containing protein [Candidatus Kapabacteria bacterium]
MKHALLFAIFAVSTLVCLAQMPAVQSNSTRHRVSTSFSPSDLMVQPAEKAEEHNQGGVTFKRVTTLELRSNYHYWPFGVWSNDMFQYEAKSNTLNIARNRALVDAQNMVTGTEVGVLRSVNNGVAWTFDRLTSTPDIFVYPTIGWINPDEGTDASKFPVMIYGASFVRSNGLAFGGFTMWNRTSGAPYQVSLSDYPAPGNGYAMNEGKLYSDNSSGSVVCAGTLNPSGSAAYGAYGMWNFNLVVDDFGQTPTIPAAWGLDKFRPSDDPTRSFNAPVLIDGDATGTLYAAFNNFSALNVDARSVQVSKSTDAGTTWGSFNEMPSNLLEQFALAHGGDIGFQYGQSPYRGGDFLVSGPEEYSFFYALATGFESVTTPGNIDSVVAVHIVEASYKNGSWSLAAVAELQTLDLSMTSIEDSIATAIGAPAVSITENGRGFEIQAARTVDGSTLILKYVDINTVRAKNEFPAVRVFTQQTNGSYSESDPITSMWDTDMFIVTRPRASAEWGASKNVTDDTDMAFRTYMPKTVASATDIPLLRVIGTNGGSISSLLPKPIYQTVYNGGASVDYANTSVTSVEDEKTYAFRFGTVAPNPVTSTAEVSFTLDRSATVGIEVYDMLGSQLSSIPTQTMSAGIHGVNVDATAFAAGTYNVALVVDGVRIMKPFVVVR